MPKISGLGLGEIKKVSGLGLGAIQKISGLGLGLLWQSISQLGMTKNGNYAIQSSYTTVPSWTPDAGTTLSGNGILVTTAGNYTIETTLSVTNTSAFSTRQVTLRLQKGTTTLATGATPSLGPGTTQAYPLSVASQAYVAGDIVTLEADSNVNNEISVVSGGTVRLVPVV